MTILVKTEGSHDKLIGTIHERDGYARDPAKADVDAWVRGISEVP